MSRQSDVLPPKLGQTGDVKHCREGAQVEVANTTAVYEKYGNEYDEMDMDRMGKLQELRVSRTGS